jgi:flagellar biosynthesis GTPase FlhF
LNKNPFAFKNNFYLIISHIYSQKKIIFHLFPHVRKTRRNKIQLKVEEEVVKKEEEEEEQEQEEEEGNEEEDQKDEKEENQAEEKNENEGENEIQLRQEIEVEENNNNKIELQEEENEVKKNKDEYYLSPEIKVNVEWFKDGNENVDILFSTNSNKKLALHWGVSNANSQGNWSHIDSLCYPPLTKEFDNFALQTEFSFLENDNSAQKIHIKFPKDDYNSLNFVFLEKDANRWYNNGEKDYHIYFN